MTGLPKLRFRTPTKVHCSRKGQQHTMGYARKHLCCNPWHLNKLFQGPWTHLRAPNGGAVARINAFIQHRAFSLHTSRDPATAPPDHRWSLWVSHLRWTGPGRPVRCARSCAVNATAQRRQVSYSDNRAAESNPRRRFQSIAATWTFHTSSRV